MTYLGIDPGASGALVVYQPPSYLQVADMPIVEVRRGKRNVRQVDAGQLARLVVGMIGLVEEVHAFVERVGAMPKQGVSSMFAFGRAAGVIEGVLAGLQIPFTLISPVEWTRAMRVRDGKDGSRARACELWPAHADRFARVKDDGRAEAALIAAYGAQLYREGRA